MLDIHQASNRWVPFKNGYVHTQRYVPAQGPWGPARCVLLSTFTEPCIQFWRTAARPSPDASAALRRFWANSNLCTYRSGCPWGHRTWVQVLCSAPLTPPGMSWKHPLFIPSPPICSTFQVVSSGLEGLNLSICLLPFPSPLRTAIASCPSLIHSPHSSSESDLSEMQITAPHRLQKAL